MASKTDSLTTTGSVALTLAGIDTRALIDISGTYGTVTGVIEGTRNGTSYFAIPAIDRSLNTQVTGTLSPADNAAKCWEVNVYLLKGVRFRTTAVGSGTVAVSIESSTQVGVSTPAVTIAPIKYTTFSFPVDLVNITTAQDVVTNFTPGFAGRVISVAFVMNKPVTVASKLATLNLEIGTTNLTGGLVALTSALCTPMGAVIAGSAITAGNTFTSTDTISVEAASVTAFSEGTGSVQIVVAQD